MKTKYEYNRPSPDSVTKASNGTEKELEGDNYGLIDL
jgi:hypothetical protein